MSAELPSGETAARPVLRLIHGSADGTDVAVELAALVAVLAARSGPDDAAPPVRSAWADPARRLRPPVHPSVGGWVRSGLPR